MNQFENMGLLIEDTLSGKADSKVDALSQAAINKTATVQAKTNTLRPYDPYTTAVGGNTDKGVLSASEVESDVRNMAPDELYGKYGSAARNLLLDSANANAQVYRDSVIKSNQPIQDAGAAAVGAGLSGIGNVAAFLVDKVNSEAGVAIADRVAKADAAWTRNYLSDSVQSARKLQQTESKLTSGDNAVLYEQDVANGSSEFTAGAKEIGRNIFDVMANAIDDHRVLVDGTAQGVGSMLSYGPTGKVIEKAIGAVADTKAIQMAAELDRATKVASVARVADKAVDLAPTALAIGLTEGAGTYGGTVEEVMNTPFSAISMNAPDSEIKREYWANVDAGMNADEAFNKAKVTIASKAGSEAGNRQMAVASGLGLLTPYALNPFKVDSVKKAATNILVAEPVEEAGQSGFGQLNQNIAIQDNVDPNQSLKEGVGEAAGEGALYGVGTAATFQAPKASAEILGMAGKATADLLMKGVNKVADYGLAKEADIAAANSLKPEDTLNASEAIQTELNVAETELATGDTVAPDQTVAFMGKLKQSMAIQDTDFADMPEDAVATLTGSRNRVDAVQRLAGLLYEETDDTKAAELAGHLQKLLEPIQEIKNTDSRVLAEVSANEKVAMVIGDYIQLSNTLEEAPFVKKAMDNFLAKVTPETVDTVVPTISETEVATPKGESAVRNALLLAQRAPEKNSLSGITAILKHARNGKLVLKDFEFKSLQASLALVQAAKDIEAHNKVSGAKTPSNIVTGNILTDDVYRESSGPKESASEYTRNIIAAMKSGNTELALDYLSDMAYFVEHMGNKVRALNTHYENGNTSAPPVSYMAITPSRDGWMDSMELHKKLNVGKYGGMFVNGVESIKMAQQIAFEAKTLTDIYNGLVTAFPEIGQVSAIVPTLNADLLGDATEVNNRIKAAKTAPVKAEPKAKAEVASVKEVVSEPVVEPVVEIKEPTVVEEKVEPTVEKTVEESSVVNEVVETVEEVEESEITIEDEILENNQTTKEEAETVTEEASEIDEDANNESKRVDTGLKALFPNLVQTVRNYFYEVYTLPSENPISRFSDSGMKPLEYFLNAIQNKTNIYKIDSKGIQRKNVFDETLAAYRNLIVGGVTGPSVYDVMSFELDGLLEKYLNKPAKQGSTKTNKDRLLGGTANMTSFSEAVTLSLTEVDPVSGDVFFNDYLKQSALLAGLQYIMIMNQKGGQVNDLDLPTDLDDQTAKEVRVINSNVSRDSAVSELSNKIMKYWGIKGHPDGDLGYVLGISQSMAANVLQAMEAVGMLSFQSVSYVTSSGVYRTLTAMVPSPDIKILPDSPLAQYRDLIDDVVLYEPERVVYLEDDVVPVAEDQLNNFGFKNTLEQKAAIEQAQKVEFKINETVAQLLLGMGKDGMIELMSQSTDIPLNVNEKESIEGVNLGLVHAFEEMELMVEDAKSVSAKKKKSIFDVVFKFAMNMSKVGRLQMQGSYTPQSSKLIRAMLTPTWATVDMNDAKTKQVFFAGYAQATGVKIEQFSLEDVSAQVLENVQGKHKNLLDKVREHVRYSPAIDQTATPIINAGQLKELAKEAGIKLNFDGIHALVEMAKYLEASDVSNFRTSMFVEADGKTNGPLNALMLYSVGSFNPNWLKMIRKGGVGIGEAKPMHQMDLTDLYKVTADSLEGKIKDVINFVKSSDKTGKVVNNLSATYTLLNTLLPDFSIEFNQETQDFSIDAKRGVTKNPLTITIYGSGTYGLASKIAEIIEGELYSRMSLQLQNQERNPKMSAHEAMFPNNPDSERVYKQMMDSLEILRTSNAFFYKKKNIFLVGNRDSQAKPLSKNPKTFTLDGGDMDSITQNLKTLFVGPMHQSIWSTMGGQLSNTMDTIGQYTDNHSWFYTQLYKIEIAEALKAKKELDPQAKYLSQRELTEIRRKLAKFAPIIQNGGQHFLISKSEIDNEGGKEFSKSLAGMTIKPGMRLPTTTGVAGKAFMTIGSGDGKAIQQALVEYELENSLYLFDGVNIGVDRAVDYSNKLNKATVDSWMVNTLDGLAASARKINQLLTPAILDKIESNLPVEQAIELTSRLRDLSFSAGKLTRLSNINAARIQVLKEVPLFSDQMAALSAPYSTQPDFAGNLDDLDTVEVMNNRLNELLGGIVPSEQSKLSAYARVDANSGAKIISFPSLWDMATNAESQIFTKDQKALLIQLLASKEAKDYKIVFGSIAEIQSYNTRHGLPQIGLDEGDSFNGVTLPAQKTILIVSNKQGNEAEVLVHELLHASTINKVMAAYEGKIAEGNTEITEAAIKRLEGLMAEFLDLPTDDMPAETRASIESAKQAIQDQLADLLTDPVQSKAYALNEFMAWTLTNQGIVSELKTRAAPAILRIAKEVFEFLRAVLFGEKSKVKLGNDFYSQIRFNSSIVLKAEVTVKDIFTENALYHRSGNTSKANLTRLSSALERLIAETDKPFLATGIPNKNLAKAIQLGVDMTRRVAPHFKLTAEEESMFEIVTTALGTELALNPAALTKAQQLYDHVIQNLTTADFLDDSIVDINVREAKANEQYNVLLGRYYREQDNLGRSTLLSTFIGLVLVSDEVRKALNGMVLPKQVSNRESTVDALLENFGNSLLDSLTSAVTSDKKDRSVVGAIDAMMEGITESVLDDKSKIEKASQWTGEILDTGNAKVVQMLNAAGTKGLKSAKQMAQSNNRITRAAGYMLSGFSALASSQVGAEVSENIIQSINKTKMPQFLYEFLNDIVGSVDSNRDVYGLIKVVKSSIQRVRQNFRIEVPRVVSGKFKTDPSKQQWESLHQSLGKTDFALLVQTHGADKALEYMTNDQSRAARIAEIQKEMAKLSPRMYAAVRNDVDKLAQYMVTGKTSTMLLRNAYSIANAAVVPMKRAYTEADVKLIDELVSLEALGKLSPESVDTVKLLAGTELDGLKFVADYLVGQRKGEMEKATKGAARYNHYKGWVPVEYGVGGSLVIADDATAGDLIVKGYKRVGDYKGSGADPYALQKGYYYTDTSGKPAYSQGIFQNIKQTASGVDELTGFTSGIVAGRVMGKIAVKQVLNRLQFETGFTTEHLIPVYDENGSIIGFERPAAADKLELLKPSKELHKMVGNWRGRQVEEYKAQAFNRITVDRLDAMRVEDLKKNPSSIKGYVDLLNLPDDVINEYGFKLITPQTIQYIKDTYGSTFLVRKDVLMDVLGYPNPSVSDYWTGNSRLPKEWLDFGRGVFISFLGKNAFTRMVKTEQAVMSVVSAVRTTIVVRSVLVPVANLLSTARQLLSRGYTLDELAKGIPAKLVEIRQYVKGNLEKVKLEAELRAVHNDPKKEREIKNRVLALEDSFKRMSIWPLIEAGEFSTIADVGMSEADLEISSGNFIGFIENQINKLPPMFRTLAKYGIVSKDTALFDGLQKSVQYTDFIAKAIMYDKMTRSKNMEPTKALSIISEEFVNYDRLAGRTRTGLENLGLFWFGNFKIRSAKVALSMIRENPLHTLIASGLPFPTGSELPTTENIIYKVGDGSITGSMGPGMIVDSLDLNPWVNLTR